MILIKKNSYFHEFLLKLIDPMLLVTIVGLFIGLHQYYLNNLRLRKADTINYLQTLHNLLNNTDESLLEIINVYGFNGTNNYISCDSLSKVLQQNHEYRKQLEDLMIGFNQLAIGCQEGFFDEMTAWSANYQTVVNVSKALIPFYELLEKERGYSEGQYVCWFLRNMAYRWENDKTMGKKYNKRINRIAKTTNKKRKDNVENAPAIIIRSSADE